MQDIDKCGVYEIRHNATGKRYIGSAARSFRSRFFKHVSDLRKNRHHSPRLQNAWNKYGEDAFSFRIVEITEPRFAVAVEQTFIDYYRASDPKIGFNVSPCASSRRGSQYKRGLVFSDEHKRKLSLAGQGRRLPKSSLEKMSRSQRAKKPASDEVRQKISNAMKGRLISESHREKLSEANRNRKLTAESRKRMSHAQRCRATARTLFVMGREINAAEAAETYGVNYYTMMSRLYKGWSHHESVFGRSR